VFVAPSEGILKDFMEFGQAGVDGHEQSPPHRRAHTAEYDAKLINCRERYRRLRHTGTLPEPTGFASHPTPPDSPALHNLRLYTMANQFTSEGWQVLDDLSADCC